MLKERYPCDARVTLEVDISQYKGIWLFGCLMIYQIKTEDSDPCSYGGRQLRILDNTQTHRTESRTRLVVRSSVNHPITRFMPSIAWVLSPPTRDNCPDSGSIFQFWISGTSPPTLAEKASGLSSGSLAKDDHLVQLYINLFLPLQTTAFFFSINHSLSHSFIPLQSLIIIIIPVSHFSP